jgi:hypothetical protein
MPLNIKTIFAERGHRQALDDLSQQDRMIAAETERLGNVAPMDRRWHEIGALSGSWNGWLPVTVLDGYTIWKYPSPASFQFNENHTLFLKNRFGNVISAYEFRGAAIVEGTLFISSAYTTPDAGVSFVNVQPEAGSVDGTPFEIFSGPAMSGVFYLGMTSSILLHEVAFNFALPGTNVTLYAEYWDGTKWTSGVTPLLQSDGTANCTRRGNMKFEWPANAVDNTVNGVSRRWVRLQSSTQPTQFPTVYHALRTSGVQSMLQRSPDQLQNRQHAWTTFSNHIYVTAPNTGPGSREGMDFIRSGSALPLRRQYFAAYNRHFIESGYPYSLTIPVYLESDNPAVTSPGLREAWSGASNPAVLSGNERWASLMIIRRGSDGALCLVTRSGNSLVGPVLSGGNPATPFNQFILGTDF